MSQGSMNFDSDMQQQSLTSFFHTEKNNSNTNKNHLNTSVTTPSSVFRRRGFRFTQFAAQCVDCTLHASQISLPVPLSLVIVVVLRVCGSRSQLHSEQPCCWFGVCIRNGPTSGPRISQNHRRLLL